MKKGEIVKIIIRAIGAAGLMSALLVAPGLGKSIAILQKMTGLKKKTLQDSFYYLNKKKYIVFKREKGVYKMVLSNSGLKLLNKHSFQKMELPIDKKWDGLWRVITFDIPESKATARRSVSRKLKELGCFSLQKSVFVYPYDCRKQIDFIGNYFSAREHICIVEARHIDGEDRIKKYFELR